MMEKLHCYLNKNPNLLERKYQMSKDHKAIFGLLILTYINITEITWKKLLNAKMWGKPSKNKQHFIRHKISDTRNKLCEMVMGKL